MKNSPYTRNKAPLNSDMNVVPYIDVMLVLLVIFMVTAPMLTTGVDIDLPKESTNDITTSTIMPVIVSLKDTSELFITLEESGDIAVSETELIDKLMEQQQQAQSIAGEDVQVMIRADQSIPYGDVMALMANIQQSGISKVGLLTDAPAKK